jgi:hypothetical protein
MNAQPVKKSTKYQLFLVVIFSSLCMAQALSAASNNLRGTYHSEDFSILSPLYPSYLLFGGALLFFFLGLFAAGFALNKYDVRKAFWKILSILSVVTSLLLLVANQLTYFKDMIWHNERSQLILVWIISFWVGNIWIYSYYYLKNINKSG